MNRYLAICHALTLLEQPVSQAEFASLVRPANPLFASACITPQGFVRWLHEENLLQEQAPEPHQAADEMYWLNATGRLLHQHLLNWTARDKEAITSQKDSLRATGNDEPVEPDCPVCGSGFCALYLFVVLLERLYAGLPEWNAWESDELPLLGQALSQYFGSDSARLSLLGETRPLSSLSPLHLEALESALQNLVDLSPTGVASFWKQGEHHLLLPVLPELNRPSVRIPRLRFAQGLMPLERLEALQHLAYPDLFRKREQEPALPRPFEDHFVVLARPGLDAGRQQALLHLSDNGQDRLLHLKHQAGNWKLEQVLEL